jgi:hypothetical protein
MIFCYLPRKEIQIVYEVLIHPLTHLEDHYAPAVQSDLPVDGTFAATDAWLPPYSNIFS